MSKKNEIIDADQFAISRITARKVCYTVSVPHEDKLIDCDELQVSRNEIKQHVCEDVVYA